MFEFLTLLFMKAILKAYAIDCCSMACERLKSSVNIAMYSSRFLLIASSIDCCAVLVLITLFLRAGLVGCSMTTLGETLSP